MQHTQRLTECLLFKDSNTLDIFMHLPVEELNMVTAILYWRHGIALGMIPKENKQEEGNG